MKLVVDGREVYAYTGGKPFDPALPTIVFIHGAMNDHGEWSLFSRWFAHHGFGVLALDLPGHMRSEGPALASIEAMADWLHAVLRAAGVTRATLAGHSMGSLVALEAAARESDSAAAIKSLVMLGTCVPMPVPQPLLDLAKTDPLAAIEHVLNFSFSTLAAKPSFPGPGMWLRGEARSLMRMVGARGPDPLLFHNDFNACNQYTGGLAAAAHVRCPTHLVLGEFDQMTLPRNAREVAAITKAEVHTVKAGHFLMQEAPDDVLRALRRAVH